MTNWTRALEAAIQTECDKVPKGWFTMRQLAKQEGFSRARMAEIVQQLGDQVEVKSFKVKSGLVIRGVPHYRLRG